jgi:L-alanine-DL-glutamate epimerase-like enolase superfamily enzyme
MIVKHVDIWRLKLPFHYPFKHKLASHAGSENLVVKITADNGSAGYGEGVPRAFVTGETMEDSLSFLKETLGSHILDVAFSSPEELAQRLARLQRDPDADRFPAVRCALETALFDVAGRCWGKPLSDLLGGAVKESVCYSAVVPLVSLAQLPRFFQLVKAKRMRFLKLKVGEAHDLEVLDLARKELGWQIDIRVDANGAWTAEEALPRITAMLPYGISAVEQPVTKEDFEGLQRVSQALNIPVIADESLCSTTDARKLIEMRACRMFNIRLSKCGGLSAAITIRNLAEEAGIACQLGCHVGETSILAAAGRHFALCSDHLAYVEGSFAPYLLARDPVEHSVVFHDEGIAPPLVGPGLGVTVREDVLTELAISQVRLS